MEKSCLEADNGEGGEGGGVRTDQGTAGDDVKRNCQKADGVVPRWWFEYLCYGKSSRFGGRRTFGKGKPDGNGGRVTENGEGQLKQLVSKSVFLRAIEGGGNYFFYSGMAGKRESNHRFMTFRS